MHGRPIYTHKIYQYLSESLSVSLLTLRWVSNIIFDKDFLLKKYTMEPENYLTLGFSKQSINGTFPKRLKKTLLLSRNEMDKTSEVTKF